MLLAPVTPSGPGDLQQNKKMETSAEGVSNPGDVPTVLAAVGTSSLDSTASSACGEELAIADVPLSLAYMVEKEVGVQ